MLGVHLAHADGKRVQADLSNSPREIKGFQSNRTVCEVSATHILHGVAQRGPCDPVTDFVDFSHT